MAKAQQKTGKQSGGKGSPAKSSPGKPTAPGREKASKGKPAGGKASAPKPKPAEPKPSHGSRKPGGQPAAAHPSGKTAPARGRPLLPPLSRRTGSQPIPSGLSLDRKLDILGVVMTLIGLLTLLSWLSATNSSLTSGWTQALSAAFGWGRYLFPFGLILTGLWLILRNFERIPQFALERALGLVLLFANLLGFLHFLGVRQNEQSAIELARAGQGGGYVGAAIDGALEAALGPGGAAIALLAWLLLALALALDITLVEMARWVSASIQRLRNWLAAIFRNRPSIPIPSQPSVPSPAPASPPMPATMSPSPQTSAPGEASATAFQPSALSPAGVKQQIWRLPPIEEILDEGEPFEEDESTDLQRARLIEETLNSFGAPVRVVEINRGPTITQFGVEPDFIETRTGRTRVRVGKIAALADDLALALSARTIRIQAPVPGKGYVGIEVPNEQTRLVSLRDLIESEAFRRLKSPLRFAVGLNVAGLAVAADLAAMPHLLIAGATGTGKSVCVNSLISCLLLHNTPADLRLIMVDPKRVELTGYNGIPHLLAPVVVELERVTAVLQWVAREMDLRYRKLAEAGCRNIHEFNARQLEHPENRLPFLVVIIDELADLMMLAPEETERTLTRLAQLARATGIHLVISTQRPSVDVVTGLIKANFPARIAFAVASGVDSRVILDQPGAERLLGRGDMLFQPPEAPAPVRLQGVFVSDQEIQRLVSYWQAYAGVAPQASTLLSSAPDTLPAGVPLKQMPLWEEMENEENLDPLYSEAVDLARRQGRASISMLQRRLRIGYTRAARLIETMEEKGIVGPPDMVTGVREILDYGPAAPPVDEA